MSFPCPNCGAARSCAHRTAEPPAIPPASLRFGTATRSYVGKWSDKEENLLRELWDDPELSTARIAERIPGRTRNAVIGAAHRMDLPRKAGGHRRTGLSRLEAEASMARYNGSRHTRKAYKALGDDTTFSRFVKTGVRPHDAARLLESPRVASPKLKNRSAVKAGRSIFHAKGVKAPDVLTNVLVSGHSNVKIGRDVRKGKLFRGYWIYTLSLEERATCPSSCHHWETCYGNGMPYAKRVSHEDPAALTAKLEQELSKLCQLQHSGPGSQVLRTGVLIRLHALGDFFSREYVEFWSRMLREHSNLAIFGYTARDPISSIGIALQYAKIEHGKRFAVRWSNGGMERDCTVPITHDAERPANAFICPEQTGHVDGCGKCGLCWNTTRNVAFLEH